MMRRYNAQTQSWYNYYYVQDGLGHTRLLLDGNGNIVNRYAYDAWGNLIEYEENVPNPFTWNGAYGYEWIAITGLYHIGAREYDPRTGRWLQRDPIEASSGDPNFWRYCGNDPLNGVDPSGLDLLDDAANFFAGWGDRLTALPDWLGGDSLTQHVRRFFGVDEVVDPCSEAYLRGDLVGTVHDFLLTRGRGGGVRQGFAQGGKKAGRQARGATQASASPPISRQKQDGHIPGTPQHKNRTNQGKSTSTWNDPASADRLTREAWQSGTPVPGRPNVREYDFGRPIGIGPKGGKQSRVRVHQDSQGRIHGHPSGPETP